MELASDVVSIAKTVRDSVEHHFVTAFRNEKSEKMQQQSGTVHVTM
jgi:hypothetical protein